MLGSNGVWSQAVGFVLVRLAGPWLQLLYKETVYCTFTTIFKGNAVMNCIIVRHTRSSELINMHKD
jgi:hypothetical protein